MKTPEQPELILVGGPNGAGKTTLVTGALEEMDIEYLGADQIAYEMCPDDVSSVAVKAGREFLNRIRDRRENRKSIIVESTLSGRGLAREVKRFREAGYFIRVLFISIASAKVSAERVRIRVKKGGHDVPLADIKRRFQRTHVNFWELYRPLADRWELYLNGVKGHQLAALGSCDDEEVTIVNELHWTCFNDNLDEHSL